MEFEKFLIFIIFQITPSDSGYLTDSALIPDIQHSIPVRALLRGTTFLILQHSSLFSLNYKN